MTQKAWLTVCTLCLSYYTWAQDSTSLRPAMLPAGIKPYKLKVGPSLSAMNGQIGTGATILFNVNDKIGIGLSGQFFSKNYKNLSQQEILQGGLQLEYSFKPEAKISPMIPFFVGKNFNTNNVAKKNIDRPGNKSNPSDVIHTGLGLEAKISNNIKWNIAGVYQWPLLASDSGFKNLNKGLRINITIKVGLGKTGTNKIDSTRRLR